MKDRTLSEDTKAYNLFHKYRNYKELITSGRVNKYVIFNYPKAIDIDGLECTVEYIRKKEKATGKKNKDDAKYIAKDSERVESTKRLYGEFYTPDKVNKGHMSDPVFENIINYGEDKVLTFSIDYNITKDKFQLTHNSIIFDIQDGMYDYLTKDNNIKKLYELEEEIDLYNQARDFILENTSSSYSKYQKIVKLASMKIELIELLKHEKDIDFIDSCLKIIKDKNYNSPNLYKAHLLLKKNIINIGTIDLAKSIIKYSSLS